MNANRVSSGRYAVALGGLLLLAAGALFVSSCSSVTRTIMAPPQIEGAHYVGNQACADCHTNIGRVFPASPHARFDKGDLKSAAMVGCESCHGPGSEHVRVGGGRGRYTVNPGQNPEACFQCHLQERAEFALPRHHPVAEGRMSCVQCHDPHGQDIRKPAGALAMARLNESCARCHREQVRPMVFEHDALREGCLACHAPHGTVTAKLLLERDANLCLKCHAQVQDPTFGRGTLYIGKINHSAFMRQGTCWSAGCHTAVHGSNVDRMLRF